MLFFVLRGSVPTLPRRGRRADARGEAVDLWKPEKYDEVIAAADEMLKATR